MEFEVEEVAVNPALNASLFSVPESVAFQRAEDGNVRYPLSMDICAAS